MFCHKLAIAVFVLLLFNGCNEETGVPETQPEVEAYFDSEYQKLCDFSSYVRSMDPGTLLAEGFRKGYSDCLVYTWLDGWFVNGDSISVDINVFLGRAACGRDSAFCGGSRYSFRMDHVPRGVYTFVIRHVYPDPYQPEIITGTEISFTDTVSIN